MESIVIILQKPIKYLVFQKVFISQKVLYINLLNYKINVTLFFSPRINIIFSISCIINYLILYIYSFMFNVYEKAIFKKHDTISSIISLSHNGILRRWNNKNRKNFALPHPRIRASL